MSSPLWPLQEALYTRLSTMTLGTAYDFLPQEPSYPYAFMEEEEVQGVQDKSGALQVVNARVSLFSLKQDSKELKDLYDELVTVMTPKLVVTGWSTVNQVLVPNGRTYRAETRAGARGRAADVNLQFLLEID